MHRQAETFCMRCSARAGVGSQSHTTAQAPIAQPATERCLRDANEWNSLEDGGQRGRLYEAYRQVLVGTVVCAQFKLEGMLD